MSWLDSEGHFTAKQLASETAAEDPPVTKRAAQKTIRKKTQTLFFQKRDVLGIENTSSPCKTGLMHVDVAKGFSKFSADALEINADSKTIMVFKLLPRRVGLSNGMTDNGRGCCRQLHVAGDSSFVSIQRQEFFFDNEALDKFYRRHTSNIEVSLRSLISEDKILRATKG